MAVLKVELKALDKKVVEAVKRQKAAQEELESYR